MDRNANLPATPRSPVKRMTAEQRAARDEQYRVSTKEFTQILNELATLFSALNALANALGKAGKGAFLSFPNPADPNGDGLPFTRADLRRAQTEFSRMLKNLKNYHRVALKKKRATLSPESLSGVYKPLVAGDALRYFFTEGGSGFGHVDPRDARSDLLMDRLELARSGYLLRNTITMLFYVYAHSQGLQDADNGQWARSDAVMDAAFGGTIPADYLSVKTPTGKFKVTKGGERKEKMVTTKYPMLQAVETGIVDRSLNTYEAIQHVFPNFDSGRFKNWAYQNIASANFSSAENYAENEDITAFFDDPQNQQIMLDEHNLVKEASRIWKEDRAARK